MMMLASKTCARAVRMGFLASQCRCHPGVISQVLRAFSVASPSDNIALDWDKNSGVAVMKMNRKPVNALSYEFMTSIGETVDQLEANKDCRGLILTSTVPNVFCAGLQLTDLHKPDLEEFKLFWQALQNSWIKLYSSRLITIAAIKGHAIAGGCMLSLACDYRIMANTNHKIGLNETTVGLPVPRWLCDGTVATIGLRKAERALQCGLLYTPEEALSLGLVDELCTEEDLSSRARAEMKKWLAIPDHARQVTKAYLRGENIKRFWAERDQDLEQFAELVPADILQKALEQVLQKIGKK